MDLYFQEHDVNPNSTDARRRSSREPSVSGFGAHILALDLDSLATSASENYGPEGRTSPSPPHVGIHSFAGVQTPHRVTESFLEALLVTAQGSATNGDAAFGGFGGGGGPPPASDDEIRKLPQVVATSPCTPMVNTSSPFQDAAVPVRSDTDGSELYSAQEKDPASSSGSTNGATVENAGERGSSSPDLVGSCAVCTDDFIAMERVTRLPCGHEFHRECVTTWLKRHCTCPVCRRELRTDNPEYEDNKRRRQRDEGASQMRHFMFN